MFILFCYFKIRFQYIHIFMSQNKINILKILKVNFCLNKNYQLDSYNYYQKNVIFFYTIDACHKNDSYLLHFFVVSQ